MGTYAKDSTLPKLPIPRLEDTCDLLKELVEPLAEEPARQKTYDAIDEFALGIGKTLQERLLEKAAELPGNQSWLRPIWDDNYLAWRERLPVHMNYVFELLPGEWGERPVESLIASLAGVIACMRDESLPVEETPNGPLSMDTLSHTIYTRIPGAARDHLYFPPLALPMTAAVVCRGHWFILSLTGEDNRTVSASAVRDALAVIRRQADELPPAVPIGAISCAKRSMAALLREQLQADKSNRINLEAMEKAVFVVCLDEPANCPFVLNLITGAPENRWFDKSLQITSSDGKLGVNLEHSGCDAGIWVYLLTQANERVRAGLPDGGRAAVRPLQWRVSTEVEAKLRGEAEAYTRFAGRVSLCQCTVDILSRNSIKAKGCSPDFFVQILFQAAYYQLTGKFRSVYEAVSTRGFYQGRTECVRPVTSASAAFVRALLDNSVGKADLQKKSQQAGAAHSVRIKRAQEALGAERHLSGLTAMLEDMPGMERPKLLDAKGYRILKHDALSTSSTTAVYIDYFGFGPVVPDGIGIGYGVKPDGLHLAASAYQDCGINPDKFIAELKCLAERAFALL